MSQVINKMRLRQSMGTVPDTLKCNKISLNIISLFCVGVPCRIYPLSTRYRPLPGDINSTELRDTWAEYLLSEDVERRNQLQNLPDLIKFHDDIVDEAQKENPTKFPK